MNTKPNREKAEILKEFRIEAYGSNYKISQQVQDAMLKALTTQREAIVKYVRDEVVGEDDVTWDKSKWAGSWYDHENKGKNKLRAEQRGKLDKLKWKTK